MIRPPKLETEEVIDAMNAFSENLYNPNKELRVSTLRILCHYELLSHESQQMDTGVSEEKHADTQCYNVHSFDHSLLYICADLAIEIIIFAMSRCLTCFYPLSKHPSLLPQVERSLC